ncbi:MAG: PQ-loop repeat-containing protein [Patescibacteria group bacterium]|nr:PQ-loop repeat-containing protein [Patescibacteria group bacterium]
MNLEFLAFVGTALVAIAYVPQIVHIIAKHCAYGISLKAWLIWLVASILIIPHALESQNNVFIVLQVVNIVAIVFILFFTYFHGQKICKVHKFL